MKQWKGSASGFTLAEIVIAMTLIAALAVPILGSFSSANQMVHTQYHTASNLARQEMEKLYEAVRQDWWATASKPLSVTTPSQPASVVLDGKTFTFTSTVTSMDVNVPPDGKEDYRKVKMTVTW